MKHAPAHYPANYGPRSYGKRSHFVRNLVIVVAILFFLPGIPAFISSGFSVPAWFAAALDFWKATAAHFGS